MSIALFIDHTILKPFTTGTEVDKLCDEAIKYNFAAVCVPPYYVKHAVMKLRGSTAKVATVIGFPFGYSTISAKISEVNKALDDEATELDMVINLAAFRNNNFDYLKMEILDIIEAINKKAVLKVIVESGMLTDDEIKTCCSLYQNYDVDFLKTSTGYAEKGATIDAVLLMRKNLPEHIKIKASGGIKSFEFAKQLIEAGAARLGCSAGVSIVNESAEAAGY
jgi:deoxyribose-phosphate aldolase